MHEETNSLGLLSIFVGQPTNYTQTYFADHSEQLSHDRINRLMRENKLTPLELRRRVRVLCKNTSK